MLGKSGVLLRRAALGPPAWEEAPVPWAASATAGRAVSEIIEVEVVGPVGRRWAWQALHDQRRRGSSQLPLSGLRPGDRLVVEVAPAVTSWEVRRVVHRPDHVGPVEVAPLAPRRSPARARPFEPGDVLLRRFRFTRDSGEDRSSKLRPCVVMEVAGGDLRVRAIHGSNSFVRRQGTGRRLLDWAAAGLRKPSVVAPLDHWIPAKGARPVGRLSPADRRRIIGPA